MNIIPSYCLSKALKFIVAAISGVISIAALQADTIEQSNVGTSQIGWNDSLLWGNGTDPVVNTNDYQTKSGFPVSFPADAIINGTTWSYTGMVRTSGNGNGGQALDTTFNGNSLILSSDTRLLGKNYGLTTATANIVLNGGYINYATDTPSNGSSGILAGTITFGSGSDLGAIFMLANTSYALNVSSTITGSASKTLQLSMTGGTGRTNQLSLTGDMSGFFGTIWVGVANAGTSSSSFFSIQTDAVNATLELVTSDANFHYNLLTNQTFHSLVLDGTPLAAGTYDAATLNGLAAGKFMDNGGSITVVPEPSVTVLCALAFMVGITQFRRRRTA